MYDYLLKNGKIVDGLRNKKLKSNLYIKDGKIDLISDEIFDAKEVLDCENLIVAPGFIDLHTHSDACSLNKKMGESMINQGVTTQIGGNCGISLVPSNEKRYEEIRTFFARTVEISPEEELREMNSTEDYVNLVNKNKLLINSGLLIGHGTLRACVMGFDDRKATKEELEEMKKLLDEQLTQGAVGMSLGLIYPPSSYGDIEEFVELSKIIKKHDKILTVHMRNENLKIFEAVDEMLEVAEKSGVHLHISHLKLMGKPNWGRSDELLKKIEDSKKKGANITCDQYPYEASSTGLTALVPGWALSGGNEKMLENLKENSKKLRDDIAYILDTRGGASKVLLTSTGGQVPSYDGKTIEEIAKENKKDEIDTIIDILLKCKGKAACVYFCISKDDVLNIMKSLDIAVASDGADFGYGISYNPHPRNFGTFPKFLQTVRENNLMPIEDAVYKITGLPAAILNKNDRGSLKVGNIADITVFNFDEIKEGSSYIKSPVKPEGIKYVFVNGKLALKDKEITNVFEGKFLK